ncbi:hypothetical protein BDZ91DRAFT_700499 [Kalaharituber pfeilii]|nr:hypothetical protein BDZ91DRAFT_700499 [Kalaharituber pfeilii]
MKRLATRAIAIATRSLSIRTLFISLIILFFISTSSLLFLLPSETLQPYIPSGIDIPRLHDVPGLSRIIGPGAHSPPPSANSTASSDSWYSSWSWLNPFSHSKDEDRVVLPVLEQRCPVYTYYDPNSEFDTDFGDGVLLAWRRAWWAQGFKPIVLGPKDAISNGLYQQFQLQENPPRLRYELFRFLAWGYMGGGVFADYRTIPIAAYHDSDLAALRRCDTPYLVRYTGQEGYIYSSPRTSIDNLLQYIAHTDDSERNATSIEEATKLDPNRNLWREEPEMTSLAIYSPEVLSEQYKNMSPRNLSILINAHVHNFFLEQFSDGLNVLQPYPILTAALMRQTYALAQSLNTCPESPWPFKCPPNRPKCKPCTINSRPTIFTLKSLSKEKPSDGTILPANKFTISAIPHPYVMVSILTFNDTRFKDMVDKLDEQFIERYTEKDVWVLAATADLFEPLFPAENRTSTLKKAIADGKEQGKGLWATTEAGWNRREVEWRLGFVLPQFTGEIPVQVEEGDLVEMAHNFVNKHSGSKGKAAKLLKATKEMNPADAEMWKFAKALNERAVLEREKWVAEEKKFQSGWGDEEQGHKWGFGWFGS